MWYDMQVVRILFMIARILARKSEKCFVHEIDNLEKEILKENGGNK